MDIFELLFAVALWLLFAFLGWRKKAARSAAPADEPGWPEWEPQEEPGADEPAGEPAGEPAEGSPRQPTAPVDLRDLIRQLKESLAPPVVPQEPAREVRQEPARPAFEEPPPPPPPPQPEIVAPVARTAPRPRRRPALANAVLADLRSGPASLARAVVLAEILGPPVALRESDGRSRRGV